MAKYGLNVPETRPDTNRNMQDDPWIENGSVMDIVKQFQQHETVIRMRY